MNLPYFISKRISQTEKGSFSAIIHKVAIASIALGIAIMVIAFMVLGGFQGNIKDKIFSFSGHLQIKKFSFTSTLEEEPIAIDSSRLSKIMADANIDHMQEFAHKPGLITKDKEVFGLLFKGVGSSFNRQFFDPYLLEGRFPTFSDTVRFSNEVMISERMANEMRVKTGERIVAYFIMDPPRTRTLVVTGIFNTGLDAFDEQMAIGDIRLIQQLNDWSENTVGGYEVFLKDANEIDAADDRILQLLSVSHTTERADYTYLNIFDWLKLLGQNVFILIGLILFVACFNMISVLFILIMERTPMIGSFKAFGATNTLIRRVFTYNGVRLVLKGMLIGNAIAFTFGLIQYYFQIIPLNPNTYYMDHVPIAWNIKSTIGVNLLTLILVGTVLILPTALISRIRPVKAIRFD